jgi:hypothetical protein
MRIPRTKANFIAQRLCPVPKNLRLKISPGYSGKDSTRMIRMKESREIRIGDSGSREIRDPRHSPITLGSLKIGPDSMYKFNWQLGRLF